MEELILSNTLLSVGANKEAKNNKGQTTYDVADNSQSNDPGTDKGRMSIPNSEIIKKFIDENESTFQKEF